MKLSDLITQLTTWEDSHPDAEIRIAMQPTWPMQSGVLQIKLVMTNAEHIADFQASMTSDLTDAEALEAQQELEKLLDENKAIIYFVEGSHIGYASKDLWDPED